MKNNDKEAPSTSYKVSITRSVHIVKMKFSDELPLVTTVTL